MAAPMAQQPALVAQQVPAPAPAIIAPAPAIVAPAPAAAAPAPPTPVITRRMDSFDGSADKVGAFIYRVYLTVTGQPEDYMIRFAEFHLEGPAMAWAMAMRTAGTTPATMDAWCAALRARFEGVAAVEQARHRLNQLRQTGSLAQYVATFTTTCAMLPSMDEGDRVYLFIRGLKGDLTREVHMRRPETLNEAMRLAQSREQLGQLAPVDSYRTSTASVKKKIVRRESLFQT
jgi:hypothetical protein